MRDVTAVAEAPRSAPARLLAEFDGTHHVVGAGRPFDIGRAADLGLDGDLYRYRRFLRITFDHDDPVTGTRRAR